jgi:hypothetical protein
VYGLPSGMWMLEIKKLISSMTETVSRLTPQIAQFSEDEKVTGKRGEVSLAAMGLGGGLSEAWVRSS